METRTNNEIEMLRQGLVGQRPVGEEVLTSAAGGGERLEKGQLHMPPWLGGFFLSEGGAVVGGGPSARAK